MKTINIHFAAILAIILTACGSGTVPDSPESGTSQGVPVEIVTGMSFPEMEFAATRAMGEQPSIDDLVDDYYAEPPSIDDLVDDYFDESPAFVLRDL